MLYQNFSAKLLAYLIVILFVLSFTESFAFTLPDTGQTKCYDDTKEIPCPKPGQDYYGQDANYIINPTSYTLMSGGTMVKDNVTGLIWENKTTDGSIHDADKRYSSHDAQNEFISQLNASKFGGYDDWRLPSMKELRSIMDYGQEQRINAEYFPNTRSEYYWSSSVYYWSPSGVAKSSSLAWRSNFGGGYNDNYSDVKSCVRAVRGGQSSGNWVSNNSTVTDKSSGLMWQQDTGNNGQPIIWKEALSYCENLTLAGYKDWRLPNIKELTSILDLTRSKPAIDTEYFPYTRSDYYWSSTSFADCAWYASFEGGYSGTDKNSVKSNKYYVRCVRGGQ